MSPIKSLTDEELVKRIRTEDKELFSYIVDRYQKKLLLYAKYLVRDEDRATDAVQNAFIKCYTNLNGFDTTKKFSSWLYRIVHNETMNMAAKYKKEQPLDYDPQWENNNIEDQVIRQEIERNTAACLAKLPVQYAEPLILFFMEEKSYTEISDILRIPMGTVATRINRGKNYMKHICQTEKST